MKIICISSNNTQGSEYFSNNFYDEDYIEPVLFIKPDSSILKTKDFYTPEFSNEIHCDLGLVIKISKLGKYILKENSAKHYEKIGLGLDFTAIDLHKYLKKNGLPWEKAKSFDGSIIVSNFYSINTSNNEINFCLQKNNNIIQKGNIKDVSGVLDKLISYVSKYFTLRLGDLVFIKIPYDSIKISEDDLIEVHFNNEKIINTKIY